MPERPPAQAKQPVTSVLERFLQHDKAIVLVAVLLLVAVAGAYTVFGVGMNMSAVQMTAMMQGMSDPMMMASVGQPVTWVLMFLMWWIMMVAMMTPSAVPLLMLFTAVKRQGPASHKAAGYTGVLLFGYLAAWALFSALATILQWGLQQADVLSGTMMVIKSQTVAGGLMVLVGAYQFSAIKNACLSRCRAPAQFIAQHHRPGSAGALRLGMQHGVYCLGCCWALMALLFVGGVMNLYWIAGLSLYVLLEKVLPQGKHIARLSGVCLIVAGVYLMAFV